MKRLISLILAIAMLLSLAPAVFAEEEAKAELTFGAVQTNKATKIDGTEFGYYTVPVIANYKTSDSKLSLFQCYIDYDKAGLKPVGFIMLQDNTQLETISTVSGMTASGWTTQPGQLDGQVTFGAAIKPNDYYDPSLTISDGQVTLFYLNFLRVDNVENGSYAISFSEPENDGSNMLENVIGLKTNTEADYDYRKSTGSLTYTDTATITVTDGVAPTLDSVSIEPSNKSAVYGAPETFKLKALSTNGADITGLVNWTVQDGLSYSADNLTVSTTDKTNAGVYTITASAVADQSQGENKTCDLTVDQAKLDSVSLTLTGYEKGQLVSAATVTGDYCTVPEGGYKWNDDVLAGNNRFEASTPYKLSVAFKLDSNYLLDAGSTVNLHVGDETVTSTVSLGNDCFIADFQLPETGSKDPATITTLPTASEATYGDTLRSVTLTGGVASVEGKFAWTNGDQPVGNAGEKTFEVTFTPNDETTYDNTTTNVTVKVNRKSIEDKDVTIDEIPSQSYTGFEIQPDLDITFKGEKLIYGTDYTVTYNDTNINVGTATGTVSGQGNYTGTCEKTFQITKSISACTIDEITGTFVYSGTAYEPTVTVKDGDKELTKDADYTVSYTDNTKAGQATVTVTAKEGSNYTGTATAHFDIAKKEIHADQNNATVGIAMVYNGQTKTSIPFALRTSEIVANDDVSLADSFSLVYFGDAFAGSGKPVTVETLSLAGADKDNYTLIQPTDLTGTINTASQTLTSNHTTEEAAATLTKGGKELDLKTLVSTTAKKDGVDYKDNLTFECTSLPDGCTLQDGILTSGNNTTDAPFEITVKGAAVDIGGDTTPEYNAATPITIYVKIVDKLDPSLMVNGLVDNMSMTYGDEKTLTWSVKNEAEGGSISFTSGKQEVIKAEGNKISAVGAGTATITVTYDSADYYDQQTFNITVNKKPITVTAENMTVVYGDGWDGLAYDIPDDALVGKDSPLSLNITPETKATSASPVGEYQITLTQAEGANPNYAVTMNPGTLTITKAPLTIESATVKSKEYDGNKTATVTAVEFSGLKNNETLTSSDYTATGEFKDANAGENKDVTVTVTLNTTSTAANYELKSNTLDAKGTIEKRTTKVKFTEIKDATYTGKPYARENYTVNSENAVFKFFKADGNSLGEEISAPTDVGKYYITAIVEETANEKLSAVTEGFEITPKSLADADITVEAIPDQTYTGEQLKPAVTIKYNGMPLTADKDYTVAYENCTNVGVATAKITGKGNYEGTTTKTFNITAKPVTNAQVTFSENEFVYDGTLKYPSEVTVVVDGKTLTEADFGQSFTNCTNAGTATAIITFKGNYSGEITKTYTIKPKPINDLNWSGSTFFYTGNAHKVTANVKESDLAKVLTTSGEVLETVNVTVKGGKQTAIGTYIATATALDNTNYTLPETGLTHPFEIKNAIASISVTNPATVSATVDGLTIKLVGTRKDNENSLQMKINGDEVYVSFTNDTVLVGVGENEYITYKLDKSDLKETPNDVTLAEKPADVPAAPANASEDTKMAVDTVKSEGGAKSEGLAAAAAAAVTSEAEKKNTSEENKEVKADVKLEIEVTNYEKSTEGKSVVTLEITPKVTYTYTDKDNEQKVETKTISNSDIKAPVTISVKLPEGMSLENLFVKHGDEYIKPEVNEATRVITWQQSSFSPSVIMSYPGSVKIELVKEDGTKLYLTLDASWINKKLPTDEGKTNFGGWKFDEIGTISTITEDNLAKLIEKAGSGTLTAKSVSGSSSDSDSKPSKPGNSSSGPLLPSLGDDELAFRDVSKYDYYYNAVKWALKKGVTSGTGRYTFSPDDACTRAQTVTFLWRAAGCPKATAKTNPFTDVSTSDYFYEAVIWAVENGITNGTSSTTFSPNASVTRAQVATFLWRANGEPAAKDSGFTDVAANAYYARAVAWAYAEGITTGTGFGVFSPEAICTRAQIVTFLFRNAK